MAKRNCRVAVGEDVFECSLSGESGPRIVFINGFRMPMHSWRELFPQVAELGRIFSYDRLGVGKSGKASCPQSGDVVVNSLRRLLREVGFVPPYVLVAHSVGGLFANLYARMEPGEVSSVVLVDSSHPDEKELQRAFRLPFLLHRLNEGIKSIERVFDGYKYSEDEEIDETIRQIAEAGAFPPIPVAVVSGTKKMPFVPAKSFGVHLECQEGLLALSPDSRRYLAERSGHFPQITEPEVVLRAIGDMVSLGRKT